ncbi:hypothetical protein [Vibrio sp. HN007]
MAGTVQFCSDSPLLATVDFVIWGYEKLFENDVHWITASVN